MLRTRTIIHCRLDGVHFRRFLGEESVRINVMSSLVMCPVSIPAQRAGKMGLEHGAILATLTVFIR